MEIRIMEIRPIHTKKEYLAAINKIEKLWNAPSKSLEGDPVNSERH